MVAAIVVNGPLAAVIEGYPSFWTSSAAADFERFLQDPERVDRAVVVFALSNLIFVFAIPFFSGVRVLVREGDRSGFLGVIAGIAVPLFLAGGLASEVFSHGIPVVMASVPGYEVSLNTVLTVQGLQYVALVQGQAGLAVALIALSVAGLRSDLLPKWIWWLGVAVGIINLVRPFAAANPPLLMATFVPTFVWIVATSVGLLASGRSAAATPSGMERKRDLAQRSFGSRQLPQRLRTAKRARAR
ncbi:MAG: hypothetical protein M3N53_11695 [Actinomycetota bacterium]|nr:hypothetical protein [Actinomycetota bacterium]